jgi:DNA-binding GntR family transcriptional regulator
MDDQSTEEYTQLVEENGLALLFANRVRARIVVTLFYASEPLSVRRIAAGAGVDQTVVHEAIEPLAGFGILNRRQTDTSDKSRYALDETDELVVALRTVAELATKRYYQEDPHDAISEE